MTGFTAVSRPLNETPPLVWHAATRSREIAEQAATYGDGFLVNNLFAPTEWFVPLVQRYRRSYAENGHGSSADTMLGAAGAAYVRPRSQDALREFEPYFWASPLGRGTSLAQADARTGLTVGSPAEVVEKVLRTLATFGPYRRQLFAIDVAGLPETTVHEQLDLLGTEVVPTLHGAGAASRPRDGQAAAQQG